MSKDNFHGYDHFKTLNQDSTSEEVSKVYSDWSNTYDKEMINDLQYGAAPAATVELLTKKLEELGYGKDASILDLGCGSGFVGEELHKRGYKIIDGVDLCPEMIAKAEEKGVYRSLYQGKMASEGCKELGVDANQYDAATCVAVLTIGHVKGKGFDDFVHAVKPGGLACFTVRRLVWEDPEYGYIKKMDELSEAKKWKLIEKKYVEKYTADDGCWLLLCQIL